MKDRLESMPKGRLWPTFFFFIYIFFLFLFFFFLKCVNEKLFPSSLPLIGSLVKTLHKQSGVKERENQTEGQTDTDIKRSGR